MIIWKYRVSASRFPWQKGYNWKGMEDTGALLNRSGARFGGGWRYKLGVSVGTTTVMIDLLFGIVSISPAHTCRACGKKIDEPGWGNFHKACNKEQKK